MAKKKKNKAIPLIIGGCVVAALAVILVFTRRAADDYEEAESATDTLMDITVDDIKSFSYTDENAAETEAVTISFTKEEGQWVSDTDPSMEVDQTIVGTTASSLTGVTLVQTIEGVTDPAEYGLDTPLYVISITDMDGDTTTISLGDTNGTTGTIYAYLGGDTSTVYAVSTGITSNLTKTLADYAAESTVSSAESSAES